MIFFLVSLDYLVKIELARDTFDKYSRKMSMSLLFSITKFIMRSQYCSPRLLQIKKSSLLNICRMSLRNYLGYMDFCSMK